MIFIKLKQVLPTQYLLDYIKENSNNILEISQKQEMNFTYGKSLSLNSLKSNKRLEREKLYLIVSKDRILGYIRFDKKEKYPLVNVMNVGEYLKEN